MKKYFSIFIVITGLCLTIACKTVNTPIQLQHKGYRITNQLKADSTLVNMLQPYADSTNKTMNKVIGFATTTLYKKQPESTLGNFLADAMKLMAEKKFETKVDAAFINYGGVRVNYLQKGEITLSNIYEIMPFDNLLILQKVKGDVLQQFLDHIAEKGGWPVAGLTMHIGNKKTKDILIDGKPLDLNGYYVIANSDYIANGGDDAVMLKPIPQINKGYLLRDAFIEYTIQLTQQGKSINSSLEKRIVNDN